MLNQKKLEMSFKRYSNNFIKGISFEEVKEQYEERKQEIELIVNLNEIEKDHILLIDLSTISSYYFTKWKREVLIEGKNFNCELKKVLKITFYQCMSQELYKTRYPKMRLRYTFSEVITTLIHFTMFGWEKEEKILFNFIVDHFDSRWMKANDLNKHTWFLLELYLQFRNKTIFGTNQNLHKAVREQFEKMDLEFGLIPEELDVYTEVLKHWETPQLDEIKTFIDKMSVYHSILASELGESLEFGDFGYGFYPYEILFLLFARKQRGLPVPKEFEDFLMNTPEAKMKINDPEPYPEWDPLLKLIDGFYRKNYPDYIPNQYGELFQN